MKTTDMIGEIGSVQEFYVIKNLNHDVILGVNALAALRIKIDLEDRSLIHNNGKLSFYRKNVNCKAEILMLEKPKNKIKTSEDLQIPERVKNIIDKYQHEFHIKSEDKTMHTIELKDPTKISASRAYRRTPQMNEIISEEVRKLFEEGIIRESDSPFAAPVVIVKKYNGKPRFCINYKNLNANTVMKPFPIPHMQDLLDTVGPNIYYTSIDLKAGFHQLEVKEEDKFKTAFITRDGHFEFNKMPMGLVNSPFTFQKFMTKIFKDLL